MSQVSTRLVRFFRGEMGWVVTFFAGGLSIFGLSVGTSRWIAATANIDNYTGDFVNRVQLIVLLLCVMGIGAVWWALAMIRCTTRFQREQRSYLLVFVSLIFGISVVSPAGKSSFETVHDWYQVRQIDKANPLSAIQVTADPGKGKLLMRGDIGFGSYKVLEQAIKAHPDLKWVDIESPGGYVIEGLALARLIEKNQLNTLSFNECVGACTLVFVAGQQRHLGLEAHLGFLRRGTLQIKPGAVGKSLDSRVADYYRARGTAQFFVKAAMGTPKDTGWTAPPWQARQAGYATRLMYPNGVLFLD